VVVVIDRFGNLITNIEPAVALSNSARVRVGEATIPCARTYPDVGPDELVAYTGSFGHVEIARRNGSAAERLGASRGTQVILEGP
jgi:S-adenosylmethionine hydrolase